MSERQTYSLDQIKDMLLAQLDGVVDRYAPRAKGSYTAFGKYFTLNPGRADRSVGSFCIQMGGPKAGRWNDFASGQFGDVIDLIALSLGCDLPGAVREARAYLGLQTASPADLARRHTAAEAAAKRRKQAAADARANATRRAKQAHAIWLSGQQRLRGTPVDHYLRDQRRIDLGRLVRQPGVIRYLSECWYENTNPDTGEYTTGTCPAMVAIVTDARGHAVACHRTYLALDRSGRWNKAPMAIPKKVLGSYAGAAIHVWKGLGPRGGKPGGLSHAPPGTHVFIAEGIEDALSAALLLPGARILAAISLSNLGAVVLPDTVSGVTLIADLDENDQARMQLERAIEIHRAAGREVRIWQNQAGGKDLNDALQSAQGADRGASPNGIVADKIEGAA